jgi:hypothetical protein
MQACSGGSPSVPIYSCTWHLDLWLATSASALTGDPLATIDVPASISPRCGDDTPFGLATFVSVLGTGAGFGAHHALAIDPTDETLAVIVQRAESAGSPGVQFERLDGNGQHLLSGLTASLSALNASSWLATRAGRVFVCGDYRCAVGDTSGGSSFKFDASINLLSARGVLLLPNGIGLLGDIPPSLQVLTCN